MLYELSEGTSLVTAGGMSAKIQRQKWPAKSENNLAKNANSTKKATVCLLTELVIDA